MPTVHICVRLYVCNIKCDTDNHKHHFHIYTIQILIGHFNGSVLGVLSSNRAYKLRLYTEIEKYKEKYAHKHVVATLRVFVAATVYVPFVPVNLSYIDEVK